MRLNIGGSGIMCRMWNICNTARIENYIEISRTKKLNVIVIMEKIRVLDSDEVLKQDELALTINLEVSNTLQIATHRD